MAMPRLSWRCVACVRALGSLKPLWLCVRSVAVGRFFFVDVSISCVKLQLVACSAPEGCCECLVSSFWRTPQLRAQAQAVMFLRIARATCQPCTQKPSGRLFVDLLMRALHHAHIATTDLELASLAK